MSNVINLQPPRQRLGKRKQDKGHLDFVRTFACTICGRRPVSAHHLMHGEGVVRGMSLKAHDKFAVALCNDHHRQAHSGPQSFQIKYGDMLELEAARLWEINPANTDKAL